MWLCWGTDCNCSRSADLRVFPRTHGTANDGSIAMNILTWFKARELTDDEYIEKLRKGDAQAKRFAWLSLIQVGGFLALALTIATYLREHNEFVSETIGQAPANGISISQAFDGGVFHGLILGASVTYFLLMALACSTTFWMRRHVSRERRLLLAYYDKFQRGSGDSGSHP